MKVFNTLADLQAAPLKADSKQLVQTKGKLSIGDGLGETYYITTGTPDDETSFGLVNGNIAVIYVTSNKGFSKSLTLAEAVSSKLAKEGDTVTISDRGNGLFEYQPTGNTTGDVDIPTDTPTLTLSRLMIGDIRNTNLGLVSDKSAFASTLSEAARLRKRVVWVGDSITEQGKAGTGNGIGYTTFLENLFNGATYINEGIGGNTTLNIIDRLPTIEINNGDLYVVAIGVNDVRYNDSRGATTVNAYINNIQTIYNSLTATGAEVAFIGIWPTFWQDQFAALLRAETDRRMTQYNSALRDFCRENGLAFSDPNPVIRSVVDFANVQTLIPDGVHPDYTETIGKKLYADSVLIDDVRREDYSDNVYVNGKVFFKFVFGDNDATSGYLGLKNIAINGTNYQEAYGDTANLGFPFSADLYGSYKPAFGGFYNKAHDYPLITTVGVDAWPDSVVVSGVVTETAGNRGAKPFEVWFSTNPKAVTDIEHDSWVLYEKHNGRDGIAVNILPKNKNRFYYQLRLTSGTTVNLKKVGSRYPVKVVTQNVTATREQRFDLIFSTGATDVSDALQLTVPNGVVMWEADGEENEFTLASFSSTLGDFTIYQSTNPDALTSVVHESWVPVITESGDGTYFTPRMKPAEYVADSVATDVAGVRAALNETLNQLRLANIMKPSV